MNPRPRLHVALAAVTIGLIFAAGLILPMPFWRAQPAGPQTAGGLAAAATGALPSVTGDLAWPGVLLAVGFGLVLCLPFRPYLLALRWAEHVSTRSLLLLTAGLALVGLAIYPAYGSDLFVYLDYQRLWTVYGSNPLLAFPDQHPEDWAYRFVWIPQQPNPYGPLWPLLTWPIARLAADNLWAWIAGYKLLSLGSYVISCALIWCSVEAPRRRRALLLFAWSPLVLFEVLGKAHNDGLLAVSALAAVYFAGRMTGSTTRGALHSLLAATAGALVKLSGLAVVLALELVLIRQRNWRSVIVCAAGAGALSLMLYAPFWAGLQTLQPVLFQTSRVVWSPGALLIAVFGGLVPHMDVLARITCGLACALICLWVARYGRATYDPRDVAARSAVLLIAALLLLTTAFFAHYLVPVIALVAASGNRRLERLVVCLSIGSLAAYSVELLGVAMPAGWIGSPGYQVLGSLLTLLPAAALLLHWLVSNRWRSPLALLSEANGARFGVVSGKTSSRAR